MTIVKNFLQTYTEATSIMMLIELAEGVGFEPTRAFALPVFKTGAINRSTTPPEKIAPLFCHHHDKGQGGSSALHCHPEPRRRRGTSQSYVLRPVVAFARRAVGGLSMAGRSVSNQRAIGRSLAVCAASG